MEGELPLIEAPSTVEPQNARVLSRQFFDRLAVLEEGTHDYQYVRNTLIEMNLSLVRYAASRYRGRGDEMEDIVQVGTIGLIKAVDRFETDRGVEFSTYATPTIIGEIKRYFRDKGWAIRVPRRLQELRMQIASATAELTQSLGRSPTARQPAFAECASLTPIPVTTSPWRASKSHRRSRSTSPSSGTSSGARFSSSHGSIPWL